MEEILVLSELDQIKAVSQEYRLKILEAFQGNSATAKQISVRLGEPHSKVNYHIKALLRVGILQLVQESVRMGIVEKYYCPRAKTFRVDSEVMQKNEKPAVVNQDTQLVLESDLYLTEADVEILSQRIRMLVEEYASKQLISADGEERYKTSVRIASAQIV